MKLNLFLVILVSSCLIICFGFSLSDLLPGRKHQHDWTIKCDKKDLECWKKEFKDKVLCKKDDRECWKNLLKEFPCKLTDIQCWKTKLPHLPCELSDI